MGSAGALERLRVPGDARDKGPDRSPFLRLPSLFSIFFSFHVFFLFKIYSFFILSVFLKNTSFSLSSSESSKSNGSRTSATTHQAFWRKEGESQQEEELDEDTTDLNCAAHSSAAIPLVAGFREGLSFLSKYKILVVNFLYKNATHESRERDGGPCIHSADGQHPDFEFSETEDFDSDEWEEDPNSKPKIVMRRRTAESKKKHAKAKKNKKN